MTCTNIIFDQVIAKATERLPSLRHLAAVEIVLRSLYFSRPVDDTTFDAGKEKLKKGLTIWKAHLIQILKDSPSEERKFLRWKLVESLWFLGKDIVVMAGELEVLPETSLQE